MIFRVAAESRVTLKYILQIVVFPLFVDLLAHENAGFFGGVVIH